MARWIYPPEREPGETADEWDARWSAWLDERDAQMEATDADQP